MKKIAPIFFLSGILLFSKNPQLGQNNKLKIVGKMVAFDPVLHLASNLTFVMNREVIIFEVIHKNTKKYKIIVVEAFGEKPLPDILFEGNTNFELYVSKSPKLNSIVIDFWNSGDLPQSSGKFIFTKFFENFEKEKLKKVKTFYSKINTRKQS